MNNLTLRGLTKLKRKCIIKMLRIIKKRAAENNAPAETLRNFNIAAGGKSSTGNSSMSEKDEYDEYSQKSEGLKLLKKGKKGFLRVIFSRVGLIILFLLLQIATLIFAQEYFKDYMPHYYVFTTLFCAAMVLYLFNSSADPSSKLTWLVIIMIMPFFGALLLLYTRSDIGHRVLRDRFVGVTEKTRAVLKQDVQAMERFETQAPDAAGLSKYLARTGCHPVFAGARVTYFPLGEDKFREMLIQLEKAEHYIYLEYFILEEGLMWGKVLEILAQKVKEGVDVRLMYDGTCEISLLPHSYIKSLRELGIKCKTFSPLRPFLSTHYNYRDHRKILVIDGHTAFTGGVNLADEYINRKVRFGHWKDTAVMVQGDAARSFALMFLQMWNVDEQTPDLGGFLNSHPAPKYDEPGFVIPYGDCPLDDERVGEMVYMDILNRAKRYVHIMTPYLILDGEMETALRFAAERGVDVRLILPGIPDKKLPYALAKTHYASLLASGVKIYEYTPGFVHAKVFVSDDREAVVGTINLDYRSLYHHFECAAYMYGVPCIADIEKDFAETQAKCRRASMDTLKNEKWTTKLSGFLMKFISPLM